MKPKTFVLIALLCAIFLLVCSAVAAETSQEETKEDDAKEPEQHGGHCRHGCCGGRHHFGCRKCCKSADEAEATKQVNGDHGYEGGGGHGGGYGGGGGHGGGHGGGGGWGGGGHGGHCKYGCCGRQGKYCRCCLNAEEAKAYVQNEAKP